MFQQFGTVHASVRDGFKTEAKLSGMERKGIISHNSVLQAIERQIADLQSKLEKAQQEFFADFKALAETHGLDPNVPPTQYRLEKKTLKVLPEFIRKDHISDPEEAEQKKALRVVNTPLEEMDSVPGDGASLEEQDAQRRTDD